MPEREDNLAFLGLGASATPLEIESAFSSRYRAAGERLAAGDESARVELAVLRRAYESLMGRSAVPADIVAPEWGRPVDLTRDIAVDVETPSWWAGYLAFLLSGCSVAFLVELAIRLRHIYHYGGFLVPFAFIVASLVFSILATMLAENEYRYGKRARLVRRKGLEPVAGWVSVRFYFAALASMFGRLARWLCLPALFATVFLNFASLSGRWSLRH
jgi:hypothetical protein